MTKPNPMRQNFAVRRVREEIFFFVPDESQGDGAPEEQDSGRSTGPWRQGTDRARLEEHRARASERA